MQLPWRVNHKPAQVDSSSYSAHGLKATLLSWAAQGVSEEDRRVHGKHKASQMSVQLYSRDDIIGSLCLQTTFEFSNKSRLATSHLRGQAPLTEPRFIWEQFKKD